MTTLEIAGVRIGLQGEWTREIEKRYAPYLTKRRPDVELEVVPGEAPRGREWPYPSVTGELTLSRRDFFAEVKGGRGRAVVRDPRMALDSLLRVLLSELIAGRGFLVHAAAVGGRLFPGVTDAGKSTLARLAPKRRVLSDELVAVQRPHLFGTPFWGSYVRGTNTDRTKLEAIYFLDRQREEFVRPIPASEAVARLLECVLCFREDDQRAQWMLAEASRVVDSVPCHVLSYDARKTGWRELSRRFSPTAASSRSRR